MKLLSFLIISILPIHLFASNLDSSLVGDWPFSGNGDDESSFANSATVYGATLTADRFGNDSSAYHFNGEDAYIEIPDADELSLAATGEFTISMWMKCDTLNFPNSEKTYVHWAGKGESGMHEWVFRIYDYNSSRPNRTSAYSFNLNGGLGAGSYVQEDVSTDEWIHITAVYNYPINKIQLYKNGVLKDTDEFSDYNISPGNGDAPVRIGTRDLNSFFKGSIDDVRMYSRALDSTEIKELYTLKPSVSIKNYVESSRFALYPIPASDKLTISINDDNSASQITVVNSNETALLSKTIEEGVLNHTIDISQLKSGIYYVILQNGKEQMVKRFVVCENKR